MIDRLAEKYADSVPDSQLVKYEYVALPVYKVHLNVTLLKKKEVGIVEEFVLKLLETGVNEVDRLSGFLGIDESIINDSIATLYNNDLVQFLSNKLKITDKGIEAFRQSKLIVPQDVSYHVLIDALTGELLSTKKLFTQKEIKQKKYHSLNKSIEVPAVERLDFNKVSRLIKQQQKETLEDTFDGDLISINEIEKCYTMYKRISLLVFMNKENEEKLDIKVFEGFDRVPQYENIILRMEQEGIRQIPTDKKGRIDDEGSSLINVIPKEIFASAKENQKTLNQFGKIEQSLTQQLIDQEDLFKDEDLSEEGKLTATQEIRELKNQLEEIKKKKESSNRLLETYQHRPLLEKSLKDAKKIVLIVSPWIRFGAFDSELQNLIRETLCRGVQVIIGYGISNEDVGNDKAEQILKDMQKKSYGKHLSLVKLGNTHEKVLLMDGKYVVITSFNWLSFKGDPNKGFRQETGIYTEDESTIQSTIDSLESRMKIDIKKYFK